MVDKNLRTKKVACVGDSITKGAMSSDPAVRSYPAQLQFILGPSFNVRNFGVGGTTLSNRGDKPYKKQALYAHSLSFDPDIVIIMLGTNDAKPRNWRSKEEYKIDMISLLNVYRALNSKPKIYIATSPKVFTNNIGVMDAIISKEIVPTQKEVAQELDCPVIDIYVALENKPDMFADGVHPNDDGYLTIATEISKNI